MPKFARGTVTAAVVSKATSLSVATRVPIGISTGLTVFSLRNLTEPVARMVVTSLPVAGTSVPIATRSSIRWAGITPSPASTTATRGSATTTPLIGPTSIR